MTTTFHHPFYDETRAAFVDAKDLRPGDVLQTPTGSTEVVSVRLYHTTTVAYDLTIGTLHTYYALAGGTPVLVHSSTPCTPPLKSLHPDSSLDKSSLDSWGKQATEDILFSLRPGAKEALRVKPDGTIPNGNTRIKVLRDRGYDVDSLPRETYAHQPTNDGRGFLEHGSMSIRDRVLAVLESESKEVFLLALGHRLGISARFIFSEGGSDALQRARACNEMMIAIWLQVWAMKDAEGDGYSDSEFLPILLGKADAGNARPHLRDAIESALLSVHGNGASGQGSVSP